MAKKKVIEADLIEEKKAIEESKDVEVIKERKTSNKKKSNKTGIILSIIITFLVCLCIFGLFYEFYLKNLVIETTRYEKDVTVTDTGIADAVEKVYDSVVVVKTYIRGKDYASGTGFVYKTDKKYGYIITNNHVISNSSEVKVTFSNDKTVDATIIGNDEYADIAVLAVDKEYVLSVATTGKSESMRVGDTTFAVGAPIDSTTFSWSVTRGILSGKNRVVEVSDNYTNSVIQVLQTDTAINSGNSGGPLCNSNGEVIGVTNMKLASSSVEGMGFAIPIEEAVRYANSFISGEKITRPYLGISIYDKINFYSDDTGVYINYIENGSVAEKAGFQVGDKILKINNTNITSASYFKYELYKYNAGDKIKITVERNGKERVIEVKLSTTEGIS